MLDESPRFSRARTLLPGATDRGSASTGTGEAVVFPQDPVDEAISEISSDASVEIVARCDRPGRSVLSAPWPAWLGASTLARLSARGEATAYRHQARALERLHRGANVVVATPTASGKSRIFQLAMLAAIERDPRARALWIFPTKALARDQVEAFRELVGDVRPGAAGIATYDGDTPPEERRAARRRAHVVATNPDMLHRAVLPHHERWAAFLASCAYVVVDEAHVYRGIFGSHVAWVLRRLRRLCAHYGAAPRFVFCSATMADPGAHASALLGAPVEVEAEDGSPSGPRTHLVVQGTVVDPVVGLRRDHVEVTRRVADVLRRHRLGTLVFCRTRRRVELLTRYLREDAAFGISGTRRPSAEAEAEAARRVRGYRGGYLPELRRKIERALRAGDVDVVAATCALELGIDIGSLDAVVLSGYPGSVAATRQRAGRAGRRGRRALVVTVLGSDPLDRFVAADPKVLWDGDVEQARLDPANPRVVLPHLRCAAFEAPLGASCAEPLGFDGEDLVAAARHLAGAGALVCRPSSRGPVYVHVGGVSPADRVDLRGPLEEDFAVLEREGGTVREGHVLARVDFEDAPLYLHEGAIYPLEGATYEVLELDWDARKAFVRRVEADYYTEAVTRLRARILGERGTERRGGGGARAVAVLAEVVRSVPGFKKIRFRTHETMGYGPVRVPDLAFDTTAALVTMAPERLAVALPDADARIVAVFGAARAMRVAAAFVSMCDPSDLGLAVLDDPGTGAAGGWAEALGTFRGPSVDACHLASARPAVLLYDRRPGGAGLAEGALAQLDAVFDRAAAWVAGCGCTAGCSRCVGAVPEHLDTAASKDDVLRTIRLVAEAFGPGASAP